MEERVEGILISWFEREFGNRNALPGVLIKGIAEEICRHKYEIFEQVNNEYLLDDIDFVAHNEDVELTEEEKQRALDRYKRVENSNIEVLSYIITDIVRNRKEKENAKLGKE